MADTSKQFSLQNFRPAGFGYPTGLNLTTPAGPTSVDYLVDAKATLLVVGENGVGKRTSFEDYRSQTRGGKGIITMKTTEKTGLVAGAISVKETDEIMLITVKGQMVRTKVKDIRESGRNTQGVYIVRLQKGDRLQGVARVVETDGEEDAELPLGA